MTVDLYPEAEPAAIEVVPDAADRRLLHQHAIAHPALPGSRLRVEVSVRSFERRSFFVALDYEVTGGEGRVRVERFHPGDGDLRTVVVDHIVPKDVIPGTTNLYLGIHGGTRAVPVTEVTARLQSPPWPQFANDPEAVNVALPLETWRAAPQHVRIPAPREPSDNLRLAWHGESVALEASGDGPAFYEFEVAALPYRLEANGGYAPAPTHTYVALDPPSDALAFGDEDAWLRPSWGGGDVLASRFPYASVRWGRWSTTAPRLLFLKRPDAGITHLVNGADAGTLELYASEGEESVYVDLPAVRTAQRFVTEAPRRGLRDLRIESDGTLPAVLGVTIDTWVPQHIFSGDAMTASRWAFSTAWYPLVDGRIPSRTFWEHGGAGTAAAVFVVLGLAAGAILCLIKPFQPQAEP